MSSKTDLKIARSIYKMGIKEYISGKRTLSDKSLDTYCSVATSLYSTMFPDDIEGLTTEKIELMNNPALVENILENHETKYKKIAQKKVVLSTLAVIFELQIYRDMLLKINREHKKVLDLQEMTPEQEEAWVDTNEMLSLLTKLEKNALAIYKKKDLTPADLQEIQQYIILCLYCGKYIAPRRSQDYFNFKNHTKSINKETDNYFDKETDEFVFNSFKGRFVNSKDKEGNAKVIEKPIQRIPIPQELKKILIKWFKITGHEFLLFDIQGKQLNASQLNQRVNKMFGKTKGCGINQMRHTHLTEKYGHMIQDNKDLVADMTAMGSSIIEAKYYIQSHPVAVENILEGVNGSHPSHHPTPIPHYYIDPNNHPSTLPNTCPMCYLLECACKADQEQVLKDDAEHIEKQKKPRKPRTKKVVEIPKIEFTILPETNEPIIVAPVKVRKPRTKKAIIIEE